MCSAGEISMSNPLTSTSFSTWRWPVSVPPTETTWPSGSAPGRALLVGDQAHLDPAVRGQQRRVDVGDRVLDDVAEHALERGELQHADVQARDLPAHLDVDPGRDAARDPGEDPAQLLGQ